MPGSMAPIDPLHSAVGHLFSSFEMAVVLMSICLLLKPNGMVIPLSAFLLVPLLSVEPNLSGSTS